MAANISPLFANVKQFTVLTISPNAYKLANMRYGQRIRVARGAITQARLSEISGVSQSLISQLENSETATGSEYTNRLARALEISADWLADEIGEMKPDLYQTADKKLIAMCRAMEDRAEYVKDAAVTAVLTTRELAERARENGGNSGTHG